VDALDAADTIRIRLTVHYDGAAFHGWQVQPEHRTVQGDLEAALSRLADRPCSVVGSGRTDTGVHATGQVAAADLPSSWTPDRLRRSLNAVLSGDVWIAEAAEATPDFHPRYDAVSRTYRYEVGTSEEAASPFHRRWCWALAEPLDVDGLQAIASLIEGEHRFGAFAKAGQPERGERCRVDRAEWSETDLGVRFRITADRYLHHMVRYLVGTMVDIGRGRRDASDLTRLLARDTDTTTSPPAPPEGLFLEHVRYPDRKPYPTDDSPAATRSTTPA
jgi:tRNA pseudouridine38-40 synthase